jgi:adenylosuccinate synthase
MSKRQYLTKLQEKLFLAPDLGVSMDMENIYKMGQLKIGWPERAEKIYKHLVRKHTIAIIGLELGDEGKGRIVDNKLEALLKEKALSSLAVIRFQGGSNAGHTIEREGQKFALHQLPSGILHPGVVGIMDRGMIIHPIDLRTELDSIESKVDSLGKVFLSQDAILCTDLERAEELLNRMKTNKAEGGTGRGIGPSYAHYYDRLGLKINDLINDNWRNILSLHYERYEKDFSRYEIELSEVLVPDLEKFIQTEHVATRKLGKIEEFLDRLEDTRTWLISREMVKNTFLMHLEFFRDPLKGLIFEGAQSVGLHPWLGTWPDITSSDTTVTGIHAGTGIWRGQDVAERIGVLKLTYTSSVGERKMPTQIENEWANWVRDTANEFGATTGRPRDILYMDLPMLIYNARMAEIEVFAGTHLDIAKENETIRICTHYSIAGKTVPYQPGLHYLEDVVPNYVEVPGWDGQEARNAKSKKELPENALKYLAFIQARTGYPLISVSTGPERESFMEI